jgi:hypothetical protein
MTNKIKTKKQKTARERYDEYMEKGVYEYAVQLNKKSVYVLADMYQDCTGDNIDLVLGRRAKKSDKEEMIREILEYNMKGLKIDVCEEKGEKDVDLSLTRAEEDAVYDAVRRIR